MSHTKFDPARFPEPDELGFFMHPDVPGEEESDDVPALLREMGFRYSFASFEHDGDKDDVNSWWFAEDQLAPAEMKAIMERWSPPSPDDSGWILVAKFDTESGPYALFVLPDSQPRPCGD